MPFKLGRRVEPAPQCGLCEAECQSPRARRFQPVPMHARPAGAGIAGFHSSDVGVDIQSRYGSIRSKGRPPVPDDSWREQFHTMINNKIEAPVARATRSAAGSRVESGTSAYTPPLNRRGEFVERTGHMVGCTTDLDCYSRCGEHPTTGSAFVCSLNVSFYTHAGYNSDVADRLQANANELAESGQPHQLVTRSSEDPSFYMITEPGDDRFDVTDGSPGVCTDAHINYGNSGCSSGSDQGDHDRARLQRSVLWLGQTLLRFAH